MNASLNVSIDHSCRLICDGFSPQRSRRYWIRRAWWSSENAVRRIGKRFVPPYLASALLHGKFWRILSLLSSFSSSSISSAITTLYRVRPTWLPTIGDTPSEMRRVADPSRPRLGWPLELRFSHSSSVVPFMAHSIFLQTTTYTRTCFVVYIVLKPFGHAKPWYGNY